MAKIRLQQPVERGDETIAEVELRAPRAGDLRGLQLTQILQMDVTTLRTLLPRLTAPSIAPSEIDALSLEDFSALAFAVIGFFGGAVQRQMEAAPPS